MVDCYQPARDGLLGIQYILFHSRSIIRNFQDHFHVIYNRTVADQNLIGSKNHMKISN